MNLVWASHVVSHVLLGNHPGSGGGRNSMPEIMKNFTFLRNCRQSETPPARRRTSVRAPHPGYRFEPTWWSLRLGSSIICPINRKFFSLCIIARGSEQGAKGERPWGFEREMVSLKQSRWLASLDRNPVYRIMSVCHWRARTTAFFRGGYSRREVVSKRADNREAVFDVGKLPLPRLFFISSKCGPANLSFQTLDHISMTWL